MLRKIILPLIFALLISTVAMGQVQGLVKCEPSWGYEQTRAMSTDSADFYSSFVFDIPEGGRTDTLHLLFFATASTYGAVDLDISSIFGFDISKSTNRDTARYAWQDDSVAVKTAWGTSYEATSFLVVPAADDTLENGAAGQMTMHDAVRINVKGGGTGNGSDVDFYLKLVTSKDVTK